VVTTHLHQLQTVQKAVHSAISIVRCSLHRFPIMDSQFNWLPYVMQESKTTRIKDEPKDPNTTILSTSPSSNPLSVTRSSSTSRRGSTPSSTGPKRQRPYPSLTSDLSTRRPKSDTMSSHTYGTWSGLRGGSGRSHHPVRRSSDEEDQSAYGSLNPYMNVCLFISPTHVPLTSLLRSRNPSTWPM
jgi:hypothetical protein